MGDDYRLLAERWEAQLSAAVVEIGDIYEDVMTQWSTSSQGEDKPWDRRKIFGLAERIKRAVANVSEGLAWILHTKQRLKLCWERQKYAGFLENKLRELGVDWHNGEELKALSFEIPQELEYLFKEFHSDNVYKQSCQSRMLYCVDCPGAALLAQKALEQAVRMLETAAEDQPNDGGDIEEKRNTLRSAELSEDSARFLQAMAVIQKKLDVVYPHDVIYWRKIHDIWVLKKRLLKDWYGIEWRSPAQGGSSVIYD